LNRATALSPDDPLAIDLTATINLCDCINAWSKNPEEQKAIGTKAMEKYLRIDPNSTSMLLEKAGLFQLRGRYEESLVITDGLLRRDPESRDAMETKAYGLLRLGRAPEAMPLADALQARYPNKWPDISELDADVHYAVGDYAHAASLAQASAALMSEERLRSSIDGTIRLTQIASEARLGHLPRAKAAFEDFKSSVPSATTITAIKKWMHPSADLSGYEPLFEGLRMAGIPD